VTWHKAYFKQEVKVKISCLNHYKSVTDIFIQLSQKHVNDQSDSSSISNSVGISSIIR